MSIFLFFRMCRLTVGSSLTFPPQERSNDLLMLVLARLSVVFFFFFPHPLVRIYLAGPELAASVLNSYFFFLREGLSRL